MTTPRIAKITIGGTVHVVDLLGSSHVLAVGYGTAPYGITGYGD